MVLHTALGQACDPWGDDEGDAKNRKIHRASSRITQVSKSQQKPSTPAVSQKSSVPSLHSICLGILADHLEELAEYGDVILPHLPVLDKASLLAVANYRSQLTDSLLSLLVDTTMTSLDLRHVSHSQTKLTSKGILSACHIIGSNLLCLDVRGLVIKPRFLVMVAAACPRLQTLRIGFECNPVDTEALGETLLDIVPRLEKRRIIDIESWEDQLGSDDQANQGLAVPTTDVFVSGLSDLKCLVWSEIPHDIKMQCSSISAVSINPEQEYNNSWNSGERAIQRVHKWADIVMHCDQKQGSYCSTDSEDTIIHIAEKFRRAYESQEKRLKKTADRLWRKATREALASSGGERAIREWEQSL